LVYYSGHADADGLLLGGDRFTYRELRERLARSQAAVRVAVLDACNSGGATLDEAYGYAYGRTVAATLPTLWGPQHPAYDVQLAGVGELQLTTLQRGHQGLAFAPAASAGADGPYT